MLLGDGPLAALVASLGTHLVVYGQRYFTLQPLSAIIYFRLCAVLQPGTLCAGVGCILVVYCLNCILWYGMVGQSKTWFSLVYDMVELAASRWFITKMVPPPLTPILGQGHPHYITGSPTLMIQLGAPDILCFPNSNTIRTRCFSLIKTSSNKKWIPDLGILIVPWKTISPGG